MGVRLSPVYRSIVLEGADVTSRSERETHACASIYRVMTAAPPSNTACYSRGTGEVPPIAGCLLAPLYALCGGQGASACAWRGARRSFAACAPNTTPCPKTLCTDRLSDATNARLQTSSNTAQTPATATPETAHRGHQRSPLSCVRQRSCPQTLCAAPPALRLDRCERLLRLDAAPELRGGGHST